MLVLELLCLLIVGVHLAVASLRAPSARVYLRRAGLVALASWIAEDTCLRLYGFYAYSPKWVPFLDRMPLMVALIWPGVILSAYELAGLLLGPRRRWLPLAGAAMVLADASFMEPIAVRAGLWTWFEPGFFGVPPIAVLGWGYFAFTCMAIFERADTGRRGRGAAELLVLPLAPLSTHGALLASWWGALRWVNLPLPPWAATALAWGLGLILSARALRTRAASRVPLWAMATRIPAAAFFFGLLALPGRRDPWLVAYALAFAPPYLSLIRLRRSGAGSR